MRKVIYQYWIPAQAKDESKGINEFVSTPYPGGIKQTFINRKEGTNCFSELLSGFFHCWGTEIIESAENTCQYTIAIVEDVTTGYCHKVDPTKMRFVTPPESRKHSSEKRYHDRFSKILTNIQETSLSFKDERDRVEALCIEYGYRFCNNYCKKHDSIGTL